MTIQDRTVPHGDEPRLKGAHLRLGLYVRWAAIPCLALAAGGWSMITLAGLSSAASLASVRTELPRALTEKAHVIVAPRPQAEKVSVRLVVADKAERLALAGAIPVATASRLATPVADDRFDAVVAKAGLSHDKLLAALTRAKMEARAADTVPALAMPAQERFYAEVVETPMPLADRFGPVESLAVSGAPGHAAFAQFAVAADEPGPVQLAYAGALGLAAIDLGVPAPLSDAPLADDETDASGELMPDAVPLPPGRPRAAPARPPVTLAALPRAPKAVLSPAPGKPAANSRVPRDEELAFVRPDNPNDGGGKGGAFNRLFSTPKPRSGVAVYDISAGIVHMPDGTKLEAHSGIGKMVDNPKYVHVKMNGPTPPNTYKLSMREKRFHGVEAIRMTPVGNGKMHGRDGILAHSYLLRGGRAESHGCVAFKNYPRFLAAFKAGKVKHIVVVPSLARTPDAPMRVASNAVGI